MRYLVILILSGCQLTLAKLPDPIDLEVAKMVNEHHQALKVLVTEYNEKHKEIK